MFVFFLRFFYRVTRSFVSEKRIREIGEIFCSLYDEIRTDEILTNEVQCLC